MAALDQLLRYRSSIFLAHSAFVLDAYLDPLIAGAAAGSIVPSPEPASARAIVFVDGRPSRQLRFAVINALLMTGFKYPCIVYTVAQAEPLMLDLFSDLRRWVEVVSLEPLGLDVLDRVSYNRLLKQPVFWRAICFESVLVAQPDALLIEPLADAFFAYDYIGSPWHPGACAAVGFPLYQACSADAYTLDWQALTFNAGLPSLTDARVGNGGLSIRAPRCMEMICSGEASADEEAEDVFFSRHLAQYSQRVPSVSTAMSFACETVYSLSAAMHASYLYLPASDQAEIYERHVKHVMALVRLFD